MEGRACHLRRRACPGAAGIGPTICETKELQHKYYYDALRRALRWLAIPQQHDRGVRAGVKSCCHLLGDPGAQLIPAMPTSMRAPSRRLSGQRSNCSSTICSNTIVERPNLVARTTPA